MEAQVGIIQTLMNYIREGTFFSAPWSLTRLLEDQGVGQERTLVELRNPFYRGNDDRFYQSLPEQVNDIDEVESLDTWATSSAGEDPWPTVVYMSGSEDSDLSENSWLLSESDDEIESTGCFLCNCWKRLWRRESPQSRNLEIDDTVNNHEPASSTIGCMPRCINGRWTAEFIVPNDTWSTRHTETRRY